MKEKNKVKEKSKNSTEIINEDSNKKEFVKPMPISMKQKSSFSQTLNTTKSSNKSNETNMKIRKDFKGIKSLIESKIINFDNKTKNNSNNANMSLNILQQQNLDGKKTNSLHTLNKDIVNQYSLLKPNSFKSFSSLNNDNYSNLTDRQISCLSDYSLRTISSSGINSRLEKMPLIKAKKRKEKKWHWWQKIIKRNRKKKPISI